MSSSLRRAPSPKRRNFSWSVLRRTTVLLLSPTASVSAQPLDSPPMKMLKKLLSDSLGILALRAFTSAVSRGSGSLGSVKMATPVMARGMELGRDGGYGSRVIGLELLILRITDGSS